uniref:Uncharacterized protein n=1 Tax=viral metagenome TaxID=1070528 RepID=A0A6C0B3C0_9ZZZZ
MNQLSSRDERTLEKDTQEREFLTRTKKYGVKALNDSMIDKKKLVDKLKKILSKKYKLEEMDYIILIDKFKLDNKTITKNSIEELISHLNMELKYNSEESLEKNMETLMSEKGTFDESFIEQGLHIVSNEFSDPIAQKTHNPSNGDTTIILDLLNDIDLMNFEGNYNIPIKYTGNKKPRKIIIKDVLISADIISKYKLHMTPYILMKIREFNNNIFMNNSQKQYFTYFNARADNNNIISLSNKNSFIPDTTFTLTNINISFYDHTETLIKILEFNEDTDFLKIFLNLEF